MAVLVLLSIWAVGYELSATVIHGGIKTLPYSGIAPDLPFAIAGLLLIARGLRGQRAWALMGLGALCWAAGDVYWSEALATSSSPPVPSWADAGYLMFCPLTFAGIFALIRRRFIAAPKTLLADSLAASLAVGGLSAAVVIEPVLRNAHGGAIAVATNLAYPLVDMLLLALIVSAIALSNWRLQRTWVLLGAAVISFWIADSLYLITDATGTYQLGSWFNPLWYASPIIAAWAAWLPRRVAEVSARGKPSGARGIV
ncbi:MAG TPA: hypothetical protein VK898_14215, partial [Chloroflexota bacterium]|nr:hypothetical protein [Chloroflexota bacterium]